MKEGARGRDPPPSPPPPQALRCARSRGNVVPCGAGRGPGLPAWPAGRLSARAVAASYVSEAQKMGRGCEDGHSEDGRGRAQCCCAAMMGTLVVKHP